MKDYSLAAWMNQFGPIAHIIEEPTPYDKHIPEPGSGIRRCSSDTAEQLICNEKVGGSMPPSGPKAGGIPHRGGTDEE